MNIIKTYNENFDNFNTFSEDFCLVKYADSVYIGVDKDLNCTFVVVSDTPQKKQIKQCTKMLCIECNTQVTYTLDGEARTDIVNIIRCFSKNSSEIEMFLELVSVFIADKDYSDEHLINAFRTIKAFFENKSEPSENELRGLYAELYTIKFFKDALHLERFWQSRDKLKFDFSITDKIKIEVKSTIKPNRIHHFKHNQLMTDIYEIFIISYMLQHDDEGLNLYDLIMESKETLKADPMKLVKIDTVLKNTSDFRLKEISFNTDLTDLNMKFFKAEDVPKFNQISPNGVTNAEYDSNLDNINGIELNAFIETINSRINEEAQNV